jgi:hypothetical protein
MSSQIYEELELHQSDLLRRIAAAAKAADTHTLLSLDDELRRVASILTRIDDIGSEVRTLLNGSPANENVTATVSSARASGPVPGRGHGVKIRSDFLDRAAKAGLMLNAFRGAVFSTVSGRRLGIAIATERKPDRWFLGLNEDGFDCAALVCVPNSGKVIDICLDRNFMSSYRAYFSTSGNQVKFNVFLQGGHVMLKFPNRPSVCVDQFLYKYLELDR